MIPNYIGIVANVPLKLIMSFEVSTRTLIYLLSIEISGDTDLPPDIQALHSWDIKSL